MDHSKLLPGLERLRIDWIFPEELSQIHSIFHILQLRKCVLDEDAVVSLDDIQVDELLNYVERLVAVL